MTILKYVLLYFFYSAAGWAVESLYRSIGEKKIINSGFLTGPMCPIYGTGALVMILFLYNPFKDFPLIVFVLGMLICDAVEYVTSFLMEILFNQHWWDYTYEFCNIKGRICLKHTFFWGAGSVGFTYMIHPKVDSFIQTLSDKTIIILVCSIIVVFFIDVAHSFVKALDVRSLQAKFNSFTNKISMPIKEALGSVEITTENITNIIDNENEKINENREELFAQAENLIKDFEERLTKKTKNKLKNRLYNYPTILNNSLKELEWLKKIRNTIKANLSESEDKQ